MKKKWGETMKTKIPKRSLIILIIVLFVVLFIRSSGYRLTESGALAVYNSNNSVEILYSKQFGNIILYIVRDEFQEYLFEVKTNWHGLYKVTRKIELHPSGTDKMNRTWSSTSYPNNKYETIIAAEILDPNVKKVIFSNDDMSLENINIIKNNSTFYKELTVDNGYVVHYEIMDFEDATSFIFRLIDDNDNIIYTGR